MVEGKMTYGDSSTYVGSFDETGARSGQGIYTTTTMSDHDDYHQTKPGVTVTYCGMFVNDEMEGSGVMIYDDTKNHRDEEDELSSSSSAVVTKFVGNWKNGIRHGPGKEIRRDGTVRREGTWNDGKFCLINAKVNKA